MKTQTARLRMASAVLLVALAPFAAQATTYTSAQAGDWRTASTWTAGSGYPVAGDTAFITDGHAVTCAVGDAVAVIYVGDANASPLSRLTIAGNLTLSGQFNIGSHSTAAATYAHGKVVHESGDVTSAGAIYMAGYASATSASYEMSDGSLNLTDQRTGFLIVGRNGTATFTQSGGDVTLGRREQPTYTPVLIIASASGSSGNYTISDGTLTAVGLVGTGDTYIGQVGSGAMTISGTAQVSLRSVVLGHTAGGAGTLTLSGGSLRLNSLTEGVSVNIQTFNFSSGALSPYDDTLTLGSATAGNNVTTTLAGTGATISSNDKDAVGRIVNIYSKLTGGGNMTFTGNGTNVVFATDNDYSGATVVSNGTLRVSGSLGAASAVTVKNGATLGGTGTINGAVSVENGGILAPGGSVGTLTVGSLALSGSSTNVFELATTGASDKVVVTDNLTLDGVLNVTDLAGFESGTYVLMTFGGDLSDNGLELGGMPSGKQYSVQAGAGEVRLVVSPESAVPEMAVLGTNGIEIAWNETEPTAAAGTDFGVRLLGDSLTHTFTITNSGSAELVLTDSPAVAVLGDHAADFMVTVPPSPTNIPAGQSVTFDLKFQPLSGETRTATVSIGNTDLSHNPYTFAVQGSGPFPVMGILGIDGSAVTNGTISVSTAAGTDFGATTILSPVERTFTITNSGTYALELTNATPVTLTGTHAADFSVVSPPSASIAAGGSTTFTVWFLPKGAGTRTATVSIGNTDSGRNPYTFALRGALTAAIIPVEGKNWTMTMAYNNPGSDNAIATVNYDLNGEVYSAVPLRAFAVCSVENVKVDLDARRLSSTSFSVTRDNIYYGDHTATATWTFKAAEKWFFAFSFDPAHLAQSATTYGAWLVSTNGGPYQTIWTGAALGAGTFDVGTLDLTNIGGVNYLAAAPTNISIRVSHHYLSNEGTVRSCHVTTTTLPGLTVNASIEPQATVFRFR